MQRNPLRIPFTGPLPAPTIVPRHANTPAGAVASLTEFLSAPPSPRLQISRAQNNKTLLLTGAGISVASGLADYRGDNGTYRLNKTYRPIYYSEFVNLHEARKRYWARSFLGWTTLHRSKPNAAHFAMKDLGDMGKISTVITQNVDSFHLKAHPNLSTIELHGYLRALVCLTCRNEYPRDEFQKQLAELNPAWADFLQEALASGALNTEDPDERRKKGMRTNPDGDVDLPDAPYTTFRYPACPVCLEHPPALPDENGSRVDVDREGAWLPSSTAGILKPAVIMFGESIPGPVKEAAERVLDESSRILVAGSSLATYSAFRLVKKAKENGMPVGILNIGGVRDESKFFADVHPNGKGDAGVRCSQSAESILPQVVQALRQEGR